MANGAPAKQPQEVLEEMRDVCNHKIYHMVAENKRRQAEAQAQKEKEEALAAAMAAELEQQQLEEAALEEQAREAEVLAKQRAMREALEGPVQP